MLGMLFFNLINVFCICVFRLMFVLLNSFNIGNNVWFK